MPGQSCDVMSVEKQMNSQNSMKFKKIVRNKKRIIGFIVLVLLIFFLVWRFIKPMNIFTVQEQFERPMKVEIPSGLNSLSAKECGGCHVEIYEEWLESMHAKAWTDPYYQVDFKFDGTQQICLNCHIPLENQQENRVLGFGDSEKFDPILEANPNFDPQLRQEGVTCAVCHVKEGIIFGPFETVNAPHPVGVDPEITKGFKACKKCHVVQGNRWDAFFKYPPCGTVAEIKEKGREVDCPKCHMPGITRPVSEGLNPRLGRQHLFRGGHHPEMVKKEIKESMIKFQFTLTNIGADHYLPTGTPDRHLSLEFKIMDNEGNILKKKIHLMKRNFIWRPLIIELADTRLPAKESKDLFFEFNVDNNPLPVVLEATVRYHLLEEKRCLRINYINKEPIAYAIYHNRIDL